MTDVEPRFERRGGTPDLPATFAAFVTEVLDGRSIDENFSAESAKGKFPDFSLHDDLVLIEMKNLEAKQNDRIQSVLKENIVGSEMPFFYGRRKIDLNNENFSNGDEVCRAVSSKLNRSIERLLTKANKQFRSYRDHNPRKYALNICVILNSRISEFTPEIVGRAIQSKMCQNDGEQRFEKIDAVLYVSEKHFTTLPDGSAAYPVIRYERSDSIENDWKVVLLNHIVGEWAIHQTGKPIARSEDMKDCETVEDIPEQLSRSESWRLEYARKPYLRDYTLSELRVEFHRTNALIYLSILKGSWPKPGQWERMEGLRRHQHLNEEINRRDIDLCEMDPKKLTSEELAVAFEGFPAELVEMLSL